MQDKAERIKFEKNWSKAQEELKNERDIENTNKLCSKWYEMGRRSKNKKFKPKCKDWIKFEICPKCKKEFKTKQKKQIFCSSKCQTQFNSIKRYYKLRNKPKFKAARKIYFKKWIKKNREHFNDLCRERSRLNMRKMHYDRKKSGVCYACGGKIDDVLFKSCSRCRAYGIEWYSKNKARLKLEKLKKKSSLIVQFKKSLVA